MAPRPADPSLIDVACPACGEVYHMRPDSVGKQMECVNKLCRQRFKIEPAAPKPPLRAPQGRDGATPQAPEVLDALAIGEHAASPLPNESASDTAPPIQVDRGQLASAAGPATKPSSVLASIAPPARPNHVSSSPPSMAAPLPAADSPPPDERPAVNPS